jgi:CRISPR type III-A-associated protein Csm2
MATTSEGTAGERRCESCGRTFRPREPHHRTCRDCFQGGHPPAGGTGPGGAVASLPAHYLAKGYFDPAKGVIFAELLNGLANQVAQALSDAEVSMAQVRRYFTMARSLEDRLASGRDYAEVANELRMMKANVAAVVGRILEFRQRERLTGTLKAFLDRNIDMAVRDQKSFLKGFLPHFECVLAYFIWHNSQKGGRRRGS